MLSEVLQASPLHDTFGFVVSKNSIEVESDAQFIGAIVCEGGCEYLARRSTLTYRVPNVPFVG